MKKRMDDWVKKEGNLQQQEEIFDALGCFVGMCEERPKNSGFALAPKQKGLWL